jgi:biopolymer transport protein ExbB
VDIAASARADKNFVAARLLVATRKLAAARDFGLQSPAKRGSIKGPSKGNALFAIIQAAGWPIWFLLLASIIAVALIIERTISLRRSRILPPDLLTQVIGVYQRQGVGDDVPDKLAKDSPLGRVLAAALRNHRASREVMKEAIEESGRAVAHDLERFLTTLGTIATATPLLGLFGTVIGMIEIFGSQTPTGTNPQQLAHGISIALYNTAFGIGIAIPSLIFYRHFKNKVDTFVVEMEQDASKLVDILHGERRA